MNQTLEVLPRTFDVFLSHNSAEKQAVEAIAEKLRDEFGLKLWFDKWELKSGTVWQDKLDEGLRSSRACAIFLGPNGITPWQLQEMRVAQVLFAEQQPFYVIPVILPGGDGKNFPLFIRSNFNWIDFRDGLDSPSALKQLAQSISGETEPPPHSEFGSNVCPFKGLDSYKEEDAEFFFGREIFVEQRLVEHLRRSRFLAVVGMSGSGKSSVVRAGLIPALRRGALLGKETSPVLTMKPGARPLEELGVELLPLMQGMSLRQIIEDLKASERSLHLAFRSMTASRHLLVVDQFEEIFTQTEDDEERQAFIKNLVYAATLSDSPLLIIITMRSDFLSKCAQYRDLNSLICENLEQIPQMTSDELRRAIIEPAKRAELKFQMGLVDLILKDIAEGTNTLPLLQHTLLELWHRRRENQLSTEVYQQLGGVQGSLAQHAERVYSELSPNDRQIVQRMFMRLVTLGEGTEDTRRRAAKSELLAFGDGAHSAIEKLVGHRLLNVERDLAMDIETIEVVHEALIRGWPRLTGWIDHDRDFHRFRQKLTSDAELWQEHSRPDAEVYRGGRLEEAAEFLHARASELTPLEQDFIRAAQMHHEAEEAKEKKRFTFLRRLFIIAAIGFLGAGVAAYIANDLRKVSKSKEIGLRVLGMPDEDPRTLLTLAVNAFEASPTDEAQEALRLAVREANAKKVLRGFRNDVNEVVYSPDNSVFISFSDDSAIRIWNARDGSLERTIHTIHKTNGRFFASGNFFWNYSADSIRIWDLKTGTLLRTLGARTHILAADLSPDGSRFIVGGGDSSTRILDAGSGEELYRVHDDSGQVTKVEFSRDGTRILIVSQGVSRFRSVPMQIHLLDAGSYREIAMLRPKNRPLTSSAHFSPDSKQISTYLGDFSNGLQAIDHPEKLDLMEVWDARTGKQQYTIPDCSDWEVFCFGQFSSNGKYLLAGRNTNAVIYDASTGATLHWLRGHQGQIHAGSFFDSDRYVMTFGDDKTTRIWETSSGKLLETFRGHRSTMRSATVAADGSSLVTFGGDSTIWLYRQNQLGNFNYNAELFAATFESPDLREGETVISNTGLVTLMPYHGSTATTYNVYNASLIQRKVLSAPIGYTDYNVMLGRAAFGVNDGNVYLLDVERNQWSDYGITEAGYSQLSTLSRDNTRVVLATVTFDWAAFEKTSNGIEKLMQLGDATHPARSATISPDGRYAMVTYGSGNTITRIDLRQKKVVNRWTTDHFGVAWYMPTGDRFLAMTQESVEICDGQSGKVIGKVLGDFTSSFDYCADGSRTVFACRDKTAKIIDMKTGTVAKTIAGAENDVNVVAISPDGTLIATCEKNGTTEVWDVASGKRISVMRGFKGTVQNAIFSRDGKLLSTRGQKVDGSCRVYYTYADDVLTLAKKQLQSMK